MESESGESVGNEVSSSVSNDVSPDRLPWRRLDDLAPHYAPSLHGSYLRALLEGIESDEVSNIALSGPYGAGKSSILEGLGQRYPAQTIQVSLATVRPAGDDGVIGKRAPGASANDLQKEIVKQILYVMDPARTPASRFPRTSKFHWPRSLSWAFLAGLTGVAVQWLITLILAFAQQDTNLAWRPELYVPTLVGVVLVTFLLLRITNGRLAISDFTAGPAKLTLTDASGSYFDDYLDEIVYFFQVSKKRILVLEDMDRFDNVEVFEDLRALNVLLNHSAQLQPQRIHGNFGVWNRLKSRSPWAKTEELDLDTLESLKEIPPGFHVGPIVFVYAIRDSLLAETVTTTNDVRHDAFTRTKFFDLIVPVVPFVTEQNARGALKKELDLLVGEGPATPQDVHARPSNDLVRSIAQYFPDQRQIRNIRNEFSMYRDRLLRPGQHPVELNPDRLLALILYKNLEVADFERIRVGKSKLHDLLRFSQALVHENLDRINIRLGHPSEESQQARARDLAEHIVKRGDSLGIQFQRVRRNHPYADDYLTLRHDELASIELWRQVVAGQNLAFNNGKQLSRDAIERGFDVSLSFAEATALPLPAEERARLERERRDLESATWEGLWSAPNFVLDPQSPVWSDGKSRPAGALSFAQIVGETIGEGLASDLIAAGHLTQNFALLSAQFDSQFLGIEAQNFITSITEHPGRRPLAPVSPDAIREVIEERSPAILERSGMVNIHVLAYLLDELPNEAHRIVAQLRSWTGEDQNLTRAFLSRYGSKAPLSSLANAMSLLTGLVPAAVGLVANDSAVPEARRTVLFDAAIRGLSPDSAPTSVSENEAVRRYAQQAHSALESLTLDGSLARVVSRHLIHFGVIVENLQPLSPDARGVFVAAGKFEMTLSNLNAILGNEEPRWVSLERLQDDEDALGATLPRIDEYLTLLERQDPSEDVVTSETSEGLTRILENLAKLDEGDESAGSTLRAVAHHSSPSLRVMDIEPNAGSVQEALLLENRVEITTGNLMARFADQGRITEGIATALHENSCPERNVDADLAPFLAAVLIATRHFPALLSADILRELLEHLGGDYVLSESSLLAAEPAVAVQLINDGWGEAGGFRAVADSNLDWSVREALLAMEPAPDASHVGNLVEPEDVVAFLESEAIETEVRTYVHLHLDTLLIGPHAMRNANAIASFLRNLGVGIGVAEIHALARLGAERGRLLALLTLPGARDEFVADPVTTLDILGGDYAAIVNREGTKSPKFKPTQENRDFLAFLQSRGLVRIGRPKPDGTLQIGRTLRR